jgi:hypothetical protein
MKKLSILALSLIILLPASISFAQSIGLSFNDTATSFVIDGRTDLRPNPLFGNLPSAYVYVITRDLPELSGYEYEISSTDATTLNGGVTFYPDTSSNSGTDRDVRVATGVCFHTGDVQAGPSSTQIRLAEHIYSWLTLPPADVLYCIGPSVGSGASLPQYMECVDSATPLPFSIYDIYADNCLSDACIQVYFEWEPDGVTPVNCVPKFYRVSTKASSWGALKAAY